MVQYVDGYLGVADHPDYGNALNGLQVDGRSEVTRIATAVDASEASIRAAAEASADLLIVHHGLFWSGLEPIVGRHFRRVRALIESGMGLYACHLPLDSHPEVGNCALLGRALGVRLEARFGVYGGVEIGWWGTLDPVMTVEGLASSLGALTGSDVRVLRGGPERVERIGVVTGGGGSFVGEAVGLGLDALITGEASHHTYFDAQELGIHVLLGGHYATETFGVSALGDHLAERFSLDHVFLDLPTGL